MWVFVCLTLRRPSSREEVKAAAHCSCRKSHRYCRRWTCGIGFFGAVCEWHTYAQPADHFASNGLVTRAIALIEINRSLQSLCLLSLNSFTVHLVFSVYTPLSTSAHKCADPVCLSLWHTVVSVWPCPSCPHLHLQSQLRLSIWPPLASGRSEDGGKPVCASQSASLEQGSCLLIRWLLAFAHLYSAIRDALPSRTVAVIFLFTSAATFSLVVWTTLVMSFQWLR